MNPFLRQPLAHKNAVRAEAPIARIADGTAVLRLYDPIDSWGGLFGTSAKEFVAALDELGDDVEHLTLRINSPGGEVFEGLAILNSLRQHPAKVTVVVEGLAASAASFVAMAGDEIVMSPNSELMIHDAFGLCAGTAATMTKTARDLDHVSGNIADVYARRTGTDVETWRAAMLEETWYSATEAVAAGLADRVAGDEPDDGAVVARNRFDLSIFAHAGRAHAPAPRTPVASASGIRTIRTQEGSSPVAFSDEQLNNLRQLAGVASDADEGTILAALTEAVSEVEPQPTNSAPAIPKGMSLVDAEALASLQADAAAGRVARDRQVADEQAQIVDSAISAGKVYPAQREHFLNLLRLDPKGMEEQIKNLAVVMPTAEVGHASNDLKVEIDDAWFPQFASTTTPQER